MICQDCGADLEGTPIPSGIQHHYAEGTTHYSRRIGVEYNHHNVNHYDGISEWMCPDCGARRGRWSGKLLGLNEYERRWGR